MDHMTIVSNINPYALAEALAEQHINWDKLSNPMETMESIFGIPADRIFAPGSPLVSPKTALDDEDNLKPLTDAEALDRLNRYLTEGACAPMGDAADAPAAAPAVKPDMNKLAALLFPAQPVLDAPGDAPGDTPAPPAEGQRVGDYEHWLPDNMYYDDKGDFFADAPEYNDPIQGNLGDCYLIAAMASLAWSRDYAIRNQMIYNSYAHANPEQMDALHPFSFYDRNKKKWDRFYIDEQLPVYSSTGNLAYARSKDAGEIWPGLIERAYVMWKTDNFQYTNTFPNYTKIEGGNPGIAGSELTGGNVTFLRSVPSKKLEIWNAICGNCATFTSSSGSSYFYAGKTVNLVTASSEVRPAQCYRDAGVIANHAYSILGFLQEKNRRYVVLRNPWGTHPMTQYVRTGNWNFSHYGGYLPLGQDGIFALELDAFIMAFSEVEIVK